jgi:hypothetical protein
MPDSADIGIADIRYSAVADVPLGMSGGSSVCGRAVQKTRCCPASCGADVGPERL